MADSKASRPQGRGSKSTHAKTVGAGVSLAPIWLIHDSADHAPRMTGWCIQKLCINSCSRFP
jgi:hypothetical protein